MRNRALQWFKTNGFISLRLSLKKKIKQNIPPAKKNPKCTRRLLHRCHKNVCTFSIMLYPVKMLFECEMLEGYISFTNYTNQCYTTVLLVVYEWKSYTCGISIGKSMFCFKNNFKCNFILTSICFYVEEKKKLSIEQTRGYLISGTTFTGCFPSQHIGRSNN